MFSKSNIYLCLNFSLKPEMAKKPEPDRFQQDLAKEKQKQKQLEKEMKKQRVRQLKAANEDEDKMIRRLEKQLKIDKKRSQKHVPKMFNDGLEYALELCLPENIQKMYIAAKEAAEQEDDSDSGFQEDMAIATGKTSKNKRKRDEADKAPTEVSKMALVKKISKKIVPAADPKVAKKMAKLRQMESKYFDTDDELDSDLSGVDSEYEQGSSDDEVVEVHNKNKKKQTIEDSEDSEFDINDDDDDLEDETDDEQEEGGETDSDTEVDNDSDGISNGVKGKYVKKPVDDSESDVVNDDFANSEDFDDSDDSTMETSNNETKLSKKTGDWEDIYGRNRDKDGNVITVMFKLQLPGFFFSLISLSLSSGLNCFYCRPNEIHSAPYPSPFSCSGCNWFRRGRRQRSETS